MLFSCKALVIALSLAGCDASTRTSNKKRDLSYQLFYSYSPSTIVTDHAAIDLDHKEIDLHLTGDDKQYGKAQNVYENGGHSKSYAELTLASGLSTSVTAGSAVDGLNAAGEKVEGKIYESADAGATTIKVLYTVSPDMATYVGCQVGGSDMPVTTGCFQSSGTLNMSGQTITYTSSVNKNGRTIQGFSTNANKHRKNQDPSGPFYEDFDMFQSYYGATDYADKYIKAALSGSATGFPKNGNADFSTADADAREEAIVKATAYMSVFMYVIRELEDALDACERGCDRDDCTDTDNSLDEAVAFYTGSLTITEKSDGNLLWDLAEKRCANFGTCDGDVSAVNSLIFAEFIRLQDNLMKTECAAARKNKEIIARYMYVPMIQGALRYAYKSGEQNDQTGKSEAEGATFAAAVLPKVHACSEKDAKTIYDNMRIGNSNPTDFPAVKRAFENTYRCMGITCADVGGITDGQSYLPKAAPCSSGFLTGVGLALSLTVASIVALF